MQLLKNMHAMNDWISPDQLEEEFDVKKSTQAKMRMAGTLPYSKLGKFVRYNRAKINQMLEDSEVYHDK